MRFEIIRDKWEHFLVSIGMNTLDGNNYFDQMKAKDIEDKNYD